MNTKHFAVGLLFGASLLMASATLAGEKATVKVYEDVKINGKTLAPGRYELDWQGNGSNVELSIRQHNETVATVPATVETAKSPSTSTGYSIRTASDGTKEITSVFFAGKKLSLNLDQQAAAASSRSASNPGNK